MHLLLHWIEKKTYNVVKEAGYGGMFWIEIILLEKKTRRFRGEKPRN